MRFSVKITADDVRAESLRRLSAAFGARDAAHLAQLINEATMEAVALTDLASRGQALTAEQQARADQLRARRQFVQAHDAASKALRALDPIPANYTAAEFWP